MSKVDLDGEHRGNKPGNRRIGNARDAAAWKANDKRQEIAVEGVPHRRSTCPRCSRKSR